MSPKNIAIYCKNLDELESRTISNLSSHLNLDIINNKNNLNNYDIILQYKTNLKKDNTKIFNLEEFIKKVGCPIDRASYYDIFSNNKRKNCPKILVQDKTCFKQVKKITEKYNSYYEIYLIDFEQKEIEFNNKVIFYKFNNTRDELIKFTHLLPSKNSVKSGYLKSLGLSTGVNVIDNPTEIEKIISDNEVFEQTQNSDFTFNLSKIENLEKAEMYSIDKVKENIIDFFKKRDII